MPPKKKVKTTEGINPVSQIQAYLETNKGDHYNFEEERSYVVSNVSKMDKSINTPPLVIFWRDISRMSSYGLESSSIEFFGTWRIF